MNWLLGRLSEKNTYIGLAEAASAALVPGLPVWAQIGMGIFGAVNVLVKESK